ncbi:MAG: Short chain fatty acid transporter [Peptococcaceae bacterium BRH_c4a]|nr:MAG: Short chain fatty acid transporter [Peptococcaceae bacterium BRH_c4a]
MSNLIKQTDVQLNNVYEPEEKEGSLARLGFKMADWAEKWFPDAYVFAVAAVVIIAVWAMFMGQSVYQISVNFGSHFWDLVPFTMQAAFVIITGYILAASKPVNMLIMALAGIPKTPRHAVCFVAFFAMVSSLLSWGFSLIFSGLLIREVTRRVDGIDYRAMGAAGYLGLGSIWALGLSSAPALLMTTKGSLPPALYKISGVIPLSTTLFTWQNLVMIVVLIALSVCICYFSTPSAKKAKTAEMAGVRYDKLTIEVPKREKPGEWLEYSPILTLFISALGMVYLYHAFRTKGGFAALDYATYDFMCLILGMLLHWTPKSFLIAAKKSIPATGEVLLQFPIYAAIFGIMIAAGINDVIAKFFVEISNQHTFPALVAIYSAILGLFLPSGGGKWIVEAPYVLEAAKHLNVNMAWCVQIYNAAEALPNFINPFWMLPMMGVLNIRARDLAGYSMLQLLFHAPIVIIMVWLLAYTLPYVPPVFQ